MTENIKKGTTIKIILPTNAYFMSGIRDFTLALIKNTTQFSEKWAFRFQSVVDELCNNAIEHGSREGEEIQITFTHYEEDRIEICVEDGGTGKNHINADGMRKILEDRTKPTYTFSGIRGRGLAKIVAGWTDEIEFTDKPDGGIKVKVTKYLKDERYKESGLQQEEKAQTEIIPNSTHIVLTD